MKFLFVTYGPTHSGKTTFGARLREALGDSAKFIHVDNDVVDEFVQQNYNNLRTDPEVLARRSPSDPDLRCSYRNSLPVMRFAKTTVLS